MTKMYAYVAKNDKAKPQMKKIDMPEITNDQVLVEVKAASINPVDQNYHMMHQLFKIPTQYPLTLGNDFSGEIVEIGHNVTDFSVGDEVYGRTDHGETGTFAEYLATEPEAIAKVPKNIPLLHAAAVPLVGLTAYQALFEVLKIQKDQKVFINSGSGGVGSIAIQLAKNAGAYVATTTSQHNASLVQGLGADKVIDYHKTKFADVLQDYDAVFDSRGGAETADGLRILKSGGGLVTISGMPTPKLAREQEMGLTRRILFSMISRSLRKTARIKGVSYDFLLMRSDGEQLAEITKLIEAEKIKPVIDRVFPFDSIKEALEYTSKGHAVGKVLIQIGE
jgi:2-desacetyl-2-hydroxyethyl bacteriochlorophyllide A dehydrogenase